MKKINVPTEEEIKTYYIEQHHTKQEACEYFKCSTTTFERWLQKYDIHKSIQESTATRKIKNSSAEAKQRIVDKRKQTCMQKYGVPNAIQSIEVSKKIHETCMQKYGVPSVLSSPEVKNKIRMTMLKKYGVENLFESKEMNARIREACRQKYGGHNSQQVHIDHLDIWNSLEKFEEYLDSCEQRPTVNDLMRFFNVSDCAIGQRARKYNLESKINFRPSRSTYEDELIQLLKEFNLNCDIILNDRTVLDGQEIDIYIPEYHFGIEFNGDYWHSDVYCTDHNGRSVKHQLKSLKAESKGVFLFQIFEYEWKDVDIRKNIINRLKMILLKDNQRISGRKCQIVELTKKQKADFLTVNHIQGNDHCSKQYGLLYNNELVACMTFIHPKNNKYTWELSRFCTKHGVIVQGGASKLFKHFISELSSGDTISSYNDITKTKGDLYSVLGFECKSINNPNYVWINFNTGDIRTRYQEQAGGEVDRMHKQGYHRVCDCGTKTWVYTVK